MLQGPILNRSIDRTTTNKRERFVKVPLDYAGGIVGLSPMSHQKVLLLISTFPGKYSNNLIISRFPCRHQVNLKHSKLSSFPLAFPQCFFPQSLVPPQPKCLGPSSHPPRNLLQSLQIAPQCPCSPCWKSQTASLRWFHKSL